MANLHRQRAMLEAASEVVLSMLPIIVMLLVMAYIGRPMEVLQKPEWAFGAAIFFGQALVKLIATMTAEHRTMQVGKVVLFAACVLVFGLSPSLLVLVFVIHSGETGGHVNLYLEILQITLFVLSAFVYVVVGVASHEISAGGA